MSGCCAPMGPVGPGCTIQGCNDCSGCATTPIAMGPLDSLRNARRRLVCGSGCGETYVGEWISTPPDAVDPCCGDTFVGGAAKCQPFCWQPGSLGMLLGGMYGQRLCSGDDSSAPCACSNNLCDRMRANRMVRSAAGCSTCSSGETIVSGEVISTPMAAPAASSCGCTAKSRVRSNRATAVANAIPAGKPVKQVVR